MDALITEEITWVVPWQQLSDSDILTEEEQSELIQWRDIFRAGQFRIGEIAAEKIGDCAKRGIVIPDRRIDEAVARFSGKTPRTVRYYRETAVFFPPMIRSKYEILPFSHFVFARTMGDRWKEVLDYSVNNPGISKEMLAYRFLGGEPIGGIEFYPDSASEYPQNSGSETSYSNAGEPQKIISEISQENTAAISHTKVVAVNTFAAMLDKFCNIVLESNAHDDTKRLVIDAAKNILKYLPEILKGVAS